jgi:hypothetical protein
VYRDQVKYLGSSCERWGQRVEGEDSGKRISNIWQNHRKKNKMREIWRWTLPSRTRPRESFTQTFAGVPVAFGGVTALWICKS